MRASSVLLSAFHFIQALLLMMSGIFFLSLSKVPHVKLALWRLFDDRPGIFFLMGIGLLSIGSVFFIMMFTLYKKAFYQVKMGSSQTQVDPALIRSYVLSCMTGLHKDGHPFCEVVVHKDQKLEILTKLPISSIEEQEKRLGDLEEKISHVLRENLGYKQEFLLTVSVQES
ncbi:MAG: hypothetical protein WCG14_07670 [Chlamydiia bacterium]